MNSKKTNRSFFISVQLAFVQINGKVVKKMCVASPTAPLHGVEGGAYEQYSLWVWGWGLMTFWLLVFGASPIHPRQRGIGALMMLHVLHFNGAPQ
jgi:hypothetical protein